MVAVSGEIIIAKRRGNPRLFQPTARLSLGGSCLIRQIGIVIAPLFLKPNGTYSHRATEAGFGLLVACYNFSVPKQVRIQKLYERLGEILTLAEVAEFEQSSAMPVCEEAAQAGEWFTIVKKPGGIYAIVVRKAD